MKNWSAVKPEPAVSHQMSHQMCVELVVCVLLLLCMVPLGQLCVGAAACV